MPTLVRVPAPRSRRVSHADVAVIIPAHRAGAVLSATLASVAGQTLAPAEVVVIDDASGDDTAEVARRWSDLLPLRVIELEQNLGPAGARRVGIGTTSSELVALLDADDVWLPDHLETMSADHARHGDVITADPIRWIPGEDIAQGGIDEQMPVPPPEEQRAAILRRDFVFVGTLFERALYDRVGGFRDEFRGTEDWDLWIRMIRAGATFVRASHPTVLYRLSTTSVSADERLVAEERKVVEAAIAESDGDADRSVLAATMRHIEAKASMYAAYDAARNGRGWRARRLAVRGLRGPGRVPSRCAALLVAPGAAVRARDSRVHSPRWWLRP